MEKEPDFINPEGVKWWKEKTLTDHAHDSIDTDHEVWLTKSSSGERAFVLLHREHGVIADAKSIETMAFEIDKIKLINREN